MEKTYEVIFSEASFSYPVGMIVKELPSPMNDTEYVLVAPVVIPGGTAHPDYSTYRGGQLFKRSNLKEIPP